MVLVFVLLGVALVLFATEWLRADVVAMLVLLTLAVSGVITAAEAFAGFSDAAVITVAAMFVISRGLAGTGVAALIARHLIGLAGRSEVRLVLLMGTGVAVLSMFMNNIGAVAIMLPAVVTAGRRMGLSPSRLLIPLAFASLLGGTVTLVGTPPNLIAHSFLIERGHTGFRLFDFAPTGLPILAIGLAYLLLIGRRLLPKDPPKDVLEGYGLREFVSEVEIPADSPLVGKTLAEARLSEEHEVTVISRMVGGALTYAAPGMTLRPDDRLLVSAPAQRLIDLSEAKGIRLREHSALDAETRKNLHVVEAVVAPASFLAGKTLKEVAFRWQFGLTVLAVWRQARIARGSPLLEKVSTVRLQAGDVLLIAGTRANLQRLADDANFLIVQELDYAPPRPGRAPAAVLITAACMTLAATGVLPMVVAAPLAAALLLLTGCLRLQELYESVEWVAIVLIAGMIPLGIAMEKTGAAALLAEYLVQTLGGFGPQAVLAGLFGFTGLLTQVMSNAATLVLLAPVALGAAASLDVAPQPMLMAMAISGSCSFITPISHQANILVLGPGGYRFSHYLRTGLPLFLAIWAFSVWWVPRIWPF